MRLREDRVAAIRSWNVILADATVSGSSEPAAACTREASVKRPGKDGHRRETVSISPHFFIPMPVALIGTQVNGRANFMAVGWCSRADANPPMILCGRGNHHYTWKGIEKTKTFSVNIPSSHLLETW